MVAFVMRRIAVFLVFLLLVLTFNAYACVLPLQTVAQMDCSSDTEEPVRQICDVFLELGPQSHLSLTHAVSSFAVEFVVPQLFSDTFSSVFTSTPLPRHTVFQIHLSIPTTILRI